MLTIYSPLLRRQPTPSTEPWFARLTDNPHWSQYLLRALMFRWIFFRLSSSKTMSSAYVKMIKTSFTTCLPNQDVQVNHLKRRRRKGMKAILAPDTTDYTKKLWNPPLSLSVAKVSRFSDLMTDKNLYETPKLNSFKIKALRLILSKYQKPPINRRRSSKFFVSSLTILNLGSYLLESSGLILLHLPIISSTHHQEGGYTTHS